jgi:hypothetical protein
LSLKFAQKRIKLGHQIALRTLTHSRDDGFLAPKVLVQRAN